MYIEDRTKAAIAELMKSGLADERGVFAQRVFSCVVRLLKEFFSQTHTPFSAEFALGLFDRLARGCPLTAGFLADQKKRLEQMASDKRAACAEEDAWLSDRYGMSPEAAGIIVAPMRLSKDRGRLQRAAGTITAPEDAPGAAPPEPARSIFSPDSYGSFLDALQPASFLLTDSYGSGVTPDETDNEGAKAPVDEKEKKDMCLPDTDLSRAVRASVEGFCEDLSLFTSIDISNAIKSDGRAVRHREVSPIVRELFSDKEMEPFGYVRCQITVSLPGGKQAQAWLYHHQTADPSGYDTRAQVALPPKPAAKKPDLALNDQPAAKKPDLALNDQPAVKKPDFDWPSVVSSTHVFSPPQPPRASRVLNTAPQQLRVQKLDGRLEIPRAWIKKLGWLEGHGIDAVRDGNAVFLKPHGDVAVGEEVVYSFIIDRWNRIRLTNRALNKVGRNLGHRGQHTVSLQVGGIRVE
jgi:hypothetical protein